MGNLTVGFSSYCWDLFWKGDVCDHSEKEIKNWKANSIVNTALAHKHTHFLAGPTVPQIRSVALITAQISTCSNQPTSSWSCVLTCAKKTASRFLTLGTWHTILYMKFLVFCFSGSSKESQTASPFNNFILFLILTSVFSFHWDIFFFSLSLYFPFSLSGSDMAAHHDEHLSLKLYLYYDINLLKCSFLNIKLEINLIFTPNSQACLEWMSYWWWNTGVSLIAHFSQH